MTVPDDLLRAIGGTGGDARALDLLVAQQRRRRLLTLRALLDAVAEAPPSVLPPQAAARVLADWHLLAAAERADPAAAHRVVHYPMTGAWAERALRALTVPGASEHPAADVAHLGALAAAAAARAGLRFTADVPVRDGLLTLPTLGACAVAPGHPTVRVTGDGRRLWLHVPAPTPGPTVEIAGGGPDGFQRPPAAEPPAEVPGGGYGGFGRSRVADPPSEATGAPDRFGRPPAAGPPPRSQGAPAPSGARRPQAPRPRPRAAPAPSGVRRPQATPWRSGAAPTGSGGRRRPGGGPSGRCGTTGGRC